MGRSFKNICLLSLLSLASLLASCSGGSSDSGAGNASAGVTPYIGKWYVLATLNVNIGGTATPVTDTTQFLVSASGNAVITNTNSQCNLNISVNGNVLNYQTTCVFSATSSTNSGTSSTTSTTAACVLTVQTQAKIQGAQGSARVSGSFGPKTEVCSGAAVSYAGNLVGGEGSVPTTTGTTSGTSSGTGTGTGITTTSTSG